MPAVRCYSNNPAIGSIARDLFLPLTARDAFALQIVRTQHSPSQWTTPPVIDRSRTVVNRQARYVCASYNINPSQVHKGTGLAGAQP